MKRQSRNDNKQNYNNDKQPFNNDEINEITLQKHMDNLQLNTKVTKISTKNSATKSKWLN